MFYDSNGMHFFPRSHSSSSSEGLKKNLTDEEKMNKAIKSYLRRNLYVSQQEQDRCCVYSDEFREQTVRDQIQFGVLIIDTKGNLKKNA